MNAAARQAIRERVNTKIDLAAVTHTQAMYAILDRALLFAELENSWPRALLRAVGYILVPALLWSAIFALLRLVWPIPLWLIIAPTVLAVLTLIVCWVRDLMILAREGIDARVARSLGAAVEPPRPNPDPPPVSP